MKTALVFALAVSSVVILAVGVDLKSQNDAAHVREMKRQANAQIDIARSLQVLVADADARLAAEQQIARNSRRRVDVFVCHRMPEIGSHHWAEWLQQNGDCVLVGGER